VPPYSIVDIAVGAVDGGIEGSGYFVDSFINFDVAGDSCSPDTNDDGLVDVLDLVNVILAWATADPDADVTGDGTVDVLDLVEVILNWGAC
jgi:hypothetical protein